MRGEETVCELPGTGGERAVEDLPVRITTPNTERTVQHPAVSGSYEICESPGISQCLAKRSMIQGMSIRAAASEYTRPACECLQVYAPRGAETTGRIARAILWKV